MKIDYRSALWRGRTGRLWRLADRIVAAAEEVRGAQKPADLTFANSNLIDLSAKVRKMQLEWLEKNLGQSTSDRGRWPRM